MLVRIVSTNSGNMSKTNTQNLRNKHADNMEKIQVREGTKQHR